MARGYNPNREPSGSSKGGEFASGNSVVNVIIRKRAGKSSNFNTLGGFSESEKAKINLATSLISDTNKEVSIRPLSEAGKYAMVGHGSDNLILVNPKVTLSRGVGFTAAVIRHEVFHLEHPDMDESSIRRMVISWLDRTHLQLSDEEISILNKVD